MYTKEQLKKMSTNQLVSVLDEIIESLNKEEEINERVRSIEREKSNYLSVDIGELPTWIYFLIIPIILIFLFIPGIIKWILILAIAFVIFYFVGDQVEKKESDQQKMSEFDQQIQQCNNELAALKPILSNAKSILPEAYLSTSTLNYIKRQVQRGESWVRAVQNYQIQRITNGNGVIEYGSYPKDADGTVRPIEWIALDRKADRILLITKDCIDSLPKDYFISKSWEESPIRHWLNHDFINKAFTSKEQNNILTVKVENKCSPLQHNPDGNSTYDKVFFLSYEEALNYFSSKKLNTSIEEFSYNKHSYYCNLDKHAQVSLTPFALEHYYVNYPQLERTKQAEYNCSHNVKYSTRTCTIGDIIYDNSTVYRNEFMAISYKYFNNDTTLFLNGIGLDSIRPAMWLKLYN